jgi:hypothetical protein
MERAGEWRMHESVTPAMGTVGWRRRDSPALGMSTTGWTRCVVVMVKAVGWRRH